MNSHEKVMNCHILNIVATLQLMQAAMMFVACFSKRRDVLNYRLLAKNG